MHATSSDWQLEQPPSLLTPNIVWWWRPTDTGTHSPDKGNPKYIEGVVGVIREGGKVESKSGREGPLRIGEGQWPGGRQHVQPD
jgi:hypothetical protein